MAKELFRIGIHHNVPRPPLPRPPHPKPPHPHPHPHHRRRYALLVTTSRRRHGTFKRHQRIHILEPGKVTHMADTVSVGHQISYSIQEVDAQGNPMLTAVPFDSPPTWTDSPSAAGVDTFTVSADGTTAVLVADAVGTDSVAVSVTIGGQVFTASDIVTISAAPQVLSGIQLLSVVS